MFPKLLKRQTRYRVEKKRTEKTKIAGGLWYYRGSVQEWFSFVGIIQGSHCGRSKVSGLDNIQRIVSSYLYLSSESRWISATGIMLSWEEEFWLVRIYILYNRFRRAGSLIDYRDRATQDKTRTRTERNKVISERLLR